MSDGSRHRDAESLAKLRAKLGDLDRDQLQARFDTDPGSLSPDELDYLGLLTREAIRVFEDKARRKLGSGGSGDDPSSTS
jgi:hypothetical protein